MCWTSSSPKLNGNVIILALLRRYVILDGRWNFFPSKHSLFEISTRHWSQWYTKLWIKLISIATKSLKRSGWSTLSIPSSTTQLVLFTKNNNVFITLLQCVDMWYWMKHGSITSHRNQHDRYLRTIVQNDGFWNPCTSLDSTPIVRSFCFYFFILVRKKSKTCVKWCKWCTSSVVVPSGAFTASNDAFCLVCLGRFVGVFRSFFANTRSPTMTWFSCDL